MDPGDLDILLNFFSSDRETAIMEYQKNRGRLIKFFECNRCNHAEECADKTFDRMIKKIKESSKDNKDEKLSMLGVAYNILKEYWRSPLCKNISLDDLAPGQQPAESFNPFKSGDNEPSIDEQRKKCMRNCFNELSPEIKKLLVRYHKGEKRMRINNRKKLARELGSSIGKLRTKVCRIREKLQDCLNKCLEPILSAC